MFSLENAFQIKVSLLGQKIGEFGATLTLVGKHVVVGPALDNFPTKMFFCSCKLLIMKTDCKKLRP